MNKSPLAGKEVYLGYAARTPILEFESPLKNMTAPQLGVVAVREALKRSGLPGSAIDEVIMGQVIQIGSGSFPHRQVVLGAGLPVSVPARLVREECTSGLTSIYTAYDALTSARTGAGSIIIAGGMENMLVPRMVYPNDIKKESRRIPVVSKDALMDEAKIIDTLLDGLKNSIPDPVTGEYLNTIQCAERCAQKYGLTRKEIDDYALRSWRRAFIATEQGISCREIMPLLVYDEHGAVVSIIADDEAPVKFNHGNDEKARAAYEEKLRAWRPVYPGGVITPLNASRLSHGAAAMLVFTDDGIKKAKESFGVELKPQARITTIGRIYQEPERFPEVPYLLAQKYITGSAKYETLVETNEAFAPVPILVEREAGIEPRLHNIHGGAISRGHPLGASGAIILTRLLYNMERFSIQHGAVLICVGGGGGTALLVERV